MALRNLNAISSRTENVKWKTEINKGDLNKGSFISVPQLVDKFEIVRGSGRRLLQFNLIATNKFYAGEGNASLTSTGVCWERRYPQEQLVRTTECRSLQTNLLICRAVNGYFGKYSTDTIFAVFRRK